MHISVYSSTVYNNQDMEASLMYINTWLVKDVIFKIFLLITFAWRMIYCDGKYKVQKGSPRATCKSFMENYWFGLVLVSFI